MHDDDKNLLEVLVLHSLSGQHPMQAHHVRQAAAGMFIGACTMNLRGATISIKAYSSIYSMS